MLTDSGGIQEEIPSFGKSVLVMRNTTERFEEIETRNSKPVGTNEEDTYQKVRKLLNYEKEYDRMPNQTTNLHGDRCVKEKIVDMINNT